MIAKKQKISIVFLMTLLSISFFLTIQKANAGTAPTCSQGVFNTVTNKCESTSAHAATATTTGGVNYDTPVYKCTSANTLWIDPYGTCTLYGYASKSSFTGSVTVIGSPNMSGYAMLFGSGAGTSYYTSPTIFANSTGVFGGYRGYLYSCTASCPAGASFISSIIQTIGSTTTYSCPSSETLSGTTCSVLTQTDPTCFAGSVFDPIAHTCIALIDNAAYKSFVNFPAAGVEPGTPLMITVNMTNAGDTTWTTAANYKLGSISTDLLVGGRATLVTDNIAPGSDGTFKVSFNAPGTPGTYNFQWQMVIDAGTTQIWFGDQLAKGSLVVGCVSPKAPYVCNNPAPVCGAGDTGIITGAVPSCVDACSQNVNPVATYCGANCTARTTDCTKSGVTAGTWREVMP